MAEAPGKFSMSISFPIDLDKVLLDAEVAVLDRFGADAIHLAQQQWRGWKYSGNYPEEQKGTSNAAWAWETRVQNNEEYERGITITNNATIQRRGGTYEPVYWGRKSGKRIPYSNNRVGEYYAAYVTRSGSSKPEGEIVWEMISEELVPALQQDLMQELMDNFYKHRETQTLIEDDPSVTLHDFDIMSGETT